MARSTIKQVLQALIDDGETQTSISEGSGVPQGTISRILTGDHEDPRTSTVNKILDFADARAIAAAEKVGIDAPKATAAGGA